MVDLIEADTRLGQAIGHRLTRKAGIVLLAGEALFLRRRHDRTIFDQRRRAVVIECRQA